MPSPPLTPSNKGGRSTLKEPRTPLGRFLQEHIVSHHLVQSALGKQLHVPPYAITRLIYEDTPKLIRRWHVDEIVEAFAFNAMERRTFLGLLGLMGLSPVVHPVEEREEQMTAHTLQTLDLDALTDLAESFEVLIEQVPRQAVRIREKAEQWYAMLKAVNRHGTDARITPVQVRFGMLLGRAQEATEPWARRPAIAIQTYNALEEDILRLPPGTFPHAYARVFERRAPLYRQVGQLDQSWQEFTWGIEEIAHEDRENLLFTLYRNRAHVSLYQGNEGAWHHDLDNAAQKADGLRGDARDLFLDLVRYSEGEGYKALAYSAQQDLSTQARVQFAKQALSAYAAARRTAPLHWRGHLLMIEMGEAECLMWLDLREALQRLDQMQSVAEAYLPSLLSKIHQRQRQIQRYAAQHNLLLRGT